MGTLAQFHAVGIAWSLGTRDDSILDLFPFLHKKAHTAHIEHQQTSLRHLENYERLLSNLAIKFSLKLQLISNKFTPILNIILGYYPSILIPRADNGDYSKNW